MKNKKLFLRNLKVYGFENLENIILASLITQDPILLIGAAGTGKTFLLNSISEALGLEHRHYNASLISFDDLIGFPFPTEDKKEIHFLPTPATVWDAESVLIDELSRCKPETQNKFFSIVHERKIQGIRLDKLKYRWAAMNPFAFSGEEAEESYSGSGPLDPALADRFAFVIVVPDWKDISKEDQDLIIHPEGEGVVSNDSGALKEFVARGRELFLDRISLPDHGLVMYCRLVTDFLNRSGVRISPRRARLICRNIISASVVAELSGEIIDENSKTSIYKAALRWSIPHRAFREQFPEHTLDSAHAEAKRLVMESNPEERWLAEFHLEYSLTQKLRLILNTSVRRDLRSLALIQLLNNETPTRKTAFVFASYPIINQHNSLTEEAFNELTRSANDILSFEGKMEWRENFNHTQSVHPTWSECQKILNEISNNDNRRDRAKHFFLYLIGKNHTIAEPRMAELELNDLFTAVKYLNY